MAFSTPKCSRHRLQKLKTKLRNLSRHGSRNKKKGEKKPHTHTHKSCKLAKGYSPDQLPNHNSKTMSNKKLSKSNFHCHPLFRRSHLSPFWRIWRARRVLCSGQRQQKAFHREKSAGARSNNRTFDTAEWSRNQWMGLIPSRISPTNQLQGHRH